MNFSSLSQKYLKLKCFTLKSLLSSLVVQSKKKVSEMWFFMDILCNQFQYRFTITLSLSLHLIAFFRTIFTEKKIVLMKFNFRSSKSHHKCHINFHVLQMLSRNEEEENVKSFNGFWMDKAQIYCRWNGFLYFERFRLCQMLFDSWWIPFQLKAMKYILYSLKLTSTNQKSYTKLKTLPLLIAIPPKTIKICFP
jgi:hypothetical protein